MPKLDLHGLDRISARVALNNFIKGHHQAGTISKLEVVFGIGTGILKNEVTKYLKSSKLVAEYKHSGIWNDNLGSYTILLKKRA